MDRKEVEQLSPDVFKKVASATLNDDKEIEDSSLNNFQYIIKCLKQMYAERLPDYYKQIASAEKNCITDRFYELEEDKY